MHNIKVLVIGLEPPPWGGVAVHVKRVQEKLVQQGCQVSIWDVCKQQFERNKVSYYINLVQFIIKKRPVYIIYHTIHLRSLLIEAGLIFLVNMLIMSKMVVVIHSGRFVLSMGRLQLWLSSLLLDSCQLILVGSQLATEISLKIKLPAKFSCESPFISPDLSQKDIILAGLPSDLKSFMMCKYPLVTVSITRKIVWQGQDLYGIDLALAAFELFKQDCPNAGLLVVIGCKDGYEEYFAWFDRLTTSEIRNIYFLGEWQQEMWPLIGASQLFIRPTRSDSFGISICEALCQNVPVVASDACPRPPGTVLFKVGDAQDLYLKMNQTWQEKAVRC